MWSSKGVARVYMVEKSNKNYQCKAVSRARTVHRSAINEKLIIIIFIRIYLALVATSYVKTIYKHLLHYL